MRDAQKTKAQLRRELTALRQRVVELEAVAHTHTLTAETPSDMLRHREAHFRALVENAADVILIVEADGVIRTRSNSSPSMPGRHGYRQDDLLGKSSFDFVHPEDLPRFRNMFTHALTKSGTVPPIECRIRTADEAWAVSDVIINNLLGDPSVAGVVITLHDITVRKQAEVALQTRTHQQAALATLSQNALTEKDLSVVLEEACACVSQTLQADYSKVLELLPDGTALRLQAGVGWKAGLVGQATVSTGLDSQAGYTLQTDAPVIVEDLRTETRFSGSPLLREHKVVSGMSVIIPGRNKLFGVLGVHTSTHRIFSSDDVNFLQAAANVVAGVLERKHIEVEKHQLQAELFEAQKMEALGTLARSVAHDFNNILMVVRTFTELTQEMVPCNSAAHDNLSRILEASERARDIIRQILTFSRREAPRRTRLLLHDLVDRTLTLLRASLPSRVRLRATLAPVGVIDANATQLHQLVMNMCVNALDALRDCSGELRVTLQSVQADTVFAAQHAPLQPGPHAKLTITDTGYGIPPEVLPHIFEPLFTTKQAEEGTGLGLAIVQGIVAGHRGTISVDSQPGQGTTFTIYLPVLEEIPSSAAPLSDGTARAEPDFICGL